MGSSYGRPSLTIPGLFLRAAMALIVEAGIRLHSQAVVTPRTHENTITKRLNMEMLAAKEATGSDIVWWQMIWDYRVNTPADPADPLKEGEIDIKFRWHAIPAINEAYLAVEAKRLYGKGSSRADDYVEEGVVDFVTGKYARNHSHGIMLGYVVTGPLEKAVEAVNTAMASRRQLTAEHSAFCPDCSICAHPLTHHSVHIQRPTKKPITLVHVFLDLT